MNCQTKLRINHLTAVKSVAILESNANLNFYTWKKNTLYQKWFPTIEDVGNVAEKDKKRESATCVSNVTSPCALQHASHSFKKRVEKLEWGLKSMAA
ncbi:hypothetical protein TNCV_690911 [Trichonephila clavipes]|nr:hypothetical protein TNCV_690911 [Trichonephila clavipes]